MTPRDWWTAIAGDVLLALLVVVGTVGIVAVLGGLGI